MQGRPFRLHAIFFFSLFLTWCYGVEAQVHIAPGSQEKRSLDGALFHSDKGKGWTVEIDLPNEPLSPGASLLELEEDRGEVWFRASVTEGGNPQRVSFAIRTNYKKDPLVVAVPVAMLQRAPGRKLLLRYRSNTLDLFLDGVLVDQEWPIGDIETGEHPKLTFSHEHSALLIWNEPITDGAIIERNGGPGEIAIRDGELFGPEPKYIQYSRPRGYNTNAGDAMPFFHEGRFHLYFLLDRRQHHSKYGLGAHQWGHTSSTDLVHWKRDPVALGIDYDWEGSICTGSVFFEHGHFYAFYATRMPDRSEHLAIAESPDAVHFTKEIPSPFAEPQAPFVRGPNRDPFVFEAHGSYHMLVTAAVPGSQGQRPQGALEHLTSPDLSHWTVQPEPFLLSGSDDQPECSDLFHWGDWYYLLYSIGGVTHYRMAKDPLGPWTVPARNILDGPEAIVMKAAAFKDDRYLIVGFLQHDRMYGGDLIFRELVQEADGVLGTKFPQEMMRPIQTKRKLADLRISPDQSRPVPLPLTPDIEVTATLHPEAGGRFAMRLGSAPNSQSAERLVFDGAAQTLAWTAASGQTAKATLANVTDLSHPIFLKLVLHGTVADVLINNHRTLIHRLNSPPQSLEFETMKGTLMVSNVAVSALP